MSSGTKTNPAVLVLLVVGIFVCAGLVARNLPGALKPITITELKNLPASAGTNPAQAATSTAPTETPESQLAFDADPFVPLVVPPAPPTLPPLGSVNTASQAPLPNMGKPLGPVIGPGSGMNKLATFEVREPELVGTMLGDQPSAVFKVDQKIYTAIEGSEVIGWKVLSIQQGAAILKGMGKTVRVYTGKPVQPRSVTAVDSSSTTGPAVSGPAIPEMPADKPKHEADILHGSSVARDGSSTPEPGANEQPLPFPFDLANGSAVSRKNAGEP